MNNDIYRNVLKWMLKGDGVGMSAQAMAGAAVCMRGGRSHPYDPSDFNRCLKLIKKVPEVKLCFASVATLSPQWKALIDRWDEVEKCFIDEVGFDWSKGNKAPKTYALMKSIID